MNTRRLHNKHNRFAIGASAFGVAFLIIAVLLAAGLLQGCSSMPSFARPVVPVTTTNTVVLTVTNVVPEILWRTNTVAVTNLVAGERVVVTNVLERTPVVVTNLEVRVWTNATVLTNSFAVNPDFAGAVETVRRANSALNPTPTAPLVDWGLSLVTLAAGAVAAWKTRKLRNTQSVLETAIDVRDTLIKAVETAPASIAVPLKKHVASLADIRDLGAEVNAAVQKVTDAMADGRITAEEFLDLANDPEVTEESLPCGRRRPGGQP